MFPISSGAGRKGQIIWPSLCDAAFKCAGTSHIPIFSESVVWPGSALRQTCCPFEANELTPDSQWHEMLLGKNKGKALQGVPQGNLI